MANQYNRPSYGRGYSRRGNRIAPGVARPGPSIYKKIPKREDESFSEEDDFKPFINQIPKREDKSFSEEDDFKPFIKEEILDDLDEMESDDLDEMEAEDLDEMEAEDIDEDIMMGSEEILGAARSSRRFYDDAFKRELIARVLPKRGLRSQVTFNEKRMKLKKSLGEKKRHWLGKGFNLREARFLAFHYVPNKTTIDDCYLLLEVFGEKLQRFFKFSRTGTRTDNPKIAVAFEPQPTSGDFLNHLNRLQIAIQKKLLDDQGNLPLKILDSYTEGDLILVCYNVETKAWLKRIVPSVTVRNYETGEFMKLVAYEVPEIPPHCVKVTGEIPDDSEYLSGTDILETLHVENPSLEIGKWKVLEIKLSAKARKRKAVLFVIDSEDIPVMHKYNWILSYHGKKARFSIKTNCTSLRWWGCAKARFHEKLYRTNQTLNQNIQQKVESGTYMRQNKKTFRGNFRRPGGKNPYYLDNRNKNNPQGERNLKGVQKYERPQFQDTVGNNPKVSARDRSYHPEVDTRNERSLQDHKSERFHEVRYETLQYPSDHTDYQNRDREYDNRKLKEFQSDSFDYRSRDPVDERNRRVFSTSSSGYRIRDQDDNLSNHSDDGRYQSRDQDDNLSNHSGDGRYQSRDQDDNLRNERCSSNYSKGSQDDDLRNQSGSSHYRNIDQDDDLRNQSGSNYYQNRGQNDDLGNQSARSHYQNRDQDDDFRTQRGSSRYQNRDQNDDFRSQDRSSHYQKGRQDDDFRNQRGSSHYQKGRQDCDFRNQRGSNNYQNKGQNDDLENQSARSHYQNRDQDDDFITQRSSSRYQNRDQDDDFRSQDRSCHYQKGRQDGDFRNQRGSSHYQNSDQDDDFRNQRGSSRYQNREQDDDFRNQDHNSRYRNGGEDDLRNPNRISRYQNRDQDDDFRNQNRSSVDGVGNERKFQSGRNVYQQKDHGGRNIFRPGFRGSHRGSSRLSFRGRGDRNHSRHEETSSQNLFDY